MPRFFFDLWDHEVSRDDLGEECVDVRAARIQAVVFAGEYLRHHPELVWDGREIRTIVRDEDDQIRLTVVTVAIDGD